MALGESVAARVTRKLCEDTVSGCEDVCACVLHTCESGDVQE